MKLYYSHILFLLIVIISGCQPEINVPLTAESSIQIVKPQEGETIIEPERIIVKLNSSIRDSKIQFFIDGILMDTDSLPPYEYYWNAGYWAGHQVLIKIRHENSEGKILSTKNVLVTVSPNAVIGPVNLSPSDKSILNSTSQLILQWSSVQSAHSYQAEISNNKEFIGKTRIITTTNSGTYLDFLKYGVHYWRVRFMDAGNYWTDWNNPSSFSYVFTNGNFELGNFIGWTLEEADQNSIIIHEEEAFSGNYCAKTTLNPGDEVNNGHRVELVRYDFDVYGEIRVYEFAYKFDINYPNYPDWMIIQQFHDMPDFPHGETKETHPIGPPPIFLHYKQDTCRIMVGHLGANSEEICRFNINRGEWFKIQYIIKWSKESDGFITAYLNGKPVTPWNGTDHAYHTATVYNEVGNYFKVGQYSAFSTYSPMIAYIDEVSIHPFDQK